jgi:hypothetical protein
MARVETIDMGPSQGAIHPSTVHAPVKVFGDGAAGPIIQVDTFGSADCEIPGKLSQTIQFDKNTGQQLQAILQQAYGNK